MIWNLGYDNLGCDNLGYDNLNCDTLGYDNLGCDNLGYDNCIILVPTSLMRSH